MNIKKVIGPLLYVSAIVGGSAGLVKYNSLQQKKYDKTCVKDEFVLSTNEFKNDEQKIINWGDVFLSLPEPDDINQSNVNSNSMGFRGVVPYKNVGNAYAFTTKMSIDADGSPHAYAMPGSGNKGLDYWRSVYNESTGAIDGVILDSEGNPVENDGYCISPTSLVDATKENDDQSKYVDSEKIPYFVLPEGGFNGAELGDIGIIYNKETGKYTCAVFGDEGPIGFLGEASIATAKAIGVRPDPKKLRQFGNITYLVFPKSGDGPNKIPSIDEINEKGQKLFQEWGGLDRLKKL